ncbi:DUF5067 domain-containing protein [Companilactobacillus mishanensis]|uniref:DUF5067 domain-containing protein n=1 Tax=Companilactobacillus mishanensis TaxID=2486008 RepID=A0A5P0ZHC2_9LACO|nr:DUF5067 domain-containing protein [Companilactobacillus mishanensis]MQS44860.1 DUF5067 domain-containing protein [Companilactobacillus mishanensis]MQS52460.1 DUF5067 domain-containing protein [Companilactobacillus mishanensis]
MDNQKPTMTRGEYRKQHKPFYKKLSFIITLAVILLAIIAGLVYWGVGVAHKDNTENNSEKVENVKPKTSKKKADESSKKQASQSVKKEDEKSDEKKSDEKKTYSNPGSYNNLDYKTDDFEFKLSNDVKLVKDANGASALLIKYTYTNNSKDKQVPQKVQAANMILKQDDKVLEPTTGTGDFADLVTGSNYGIVIPGTKYDGALLVKVDNTKSDVDMYFMNIETKQYLNTMQPFKLS